MSKIRKLLLFNLHDHSTFKSRCLAFATAFFNQNFFFRLLFLDESGKKIEFDINFKQKKLWHLLSLAV